MVSGKKTLQILKEGGYPPEKHSSVPVIASGSDVFLREVQFGSLREAPNGKYGKAIGGDSFPHALDMAEARLRPRRGDAKHHHSSRFASDIECGAHDLAKLLWLLDVMIGGKHRHQRVAARRMANMNGRQPNRYRGVHSHGLEQHALACRCRYLLADGHGLFDVCDRPDALGGNQRLQTRDRLLKHGVFANDVQQFLRRARAAALPEARSAPSREDHGMCSEFFFHSVLLRLVENLSPHSRLRLTIAP